MRQPIIHHADDWHWETWDAPQLAKRGRVFWKTLFSRGLTDSDSLTVGVAVVHSGDVLHPHTHAPSEIYFILRGEAVMTLGESEQVVHAGDAVFIPGDVRHGIANRSAHDVEFLYAFARDCFDEVVYHFPE